MSRKMRLKTGESEQEPVAALHSPGVVAVLLYTVASILVASCSCCRILFNMYY